MKLMPKRFLRFWAQKMLRNNIGFMCRVSRIEKAPGGDQNEKTVICIVSTAAAFVLATALNIQNMIWGGTPSVLGFVFSLVFCACLFVLPAVAKNRAFAVVSACYAAFSAIASTVGLLAVKGIISDTLALVAVPPLTAFCGLSYIMSDYSVFYSVLIAFTLIAALNLILTARKPAAAKA